MAAVILHDYWRSSASYRLRIALNLLGLDYQRHSVDLLAGEQRSPAHLARNPQGLVPALELDGLMLTQSLAVLDYLEETRAAGFLPPDAAGRARVRALAHAIAMEIHPVCNLRVARHAVSLGGAATLEGWMQHFITLGLTGVEGLLASGDTGAFCHGDQVGMADICLVPQVYNAQRWGVDLATFPRLAAISARAAALPAFAAAHPDRVQPAG
ncbi:maleylacetoacetate isomerase [Gemmobacter aquatilis]|uniref:Maleylacetoacetate isomerase n=1 Tax=Gemmobacter aquatilis TaxID=933059 RepID=A0A1H7Y0G3_9RHOB|nr:maleylacetoacetate isomerase [Gemmobacter aquatilis]SEM39364.1 maleylacetoacetate isomerase [Gemmobacter aquatilis]